MGNENQLPPPQWAADPNDPTRWRWWDGSQWTEHYAPRHESQGPREATTSPRDAVVKRERSRFTRELIGNKEERAQAKAERLAARAEGVAESKRTATGKAGRIGSTGDTTRLSHQGNLPTVPEVLSQLRLEPPRHPLDEQVEVAGEVHHIAGIKKVFRGRELPISQRGTEISDADCVLVPEPWNPYDSNAVAVAIDTHQVGHLPADLACHYAGPLAQLANAGLLATGRARVWAKDDGGGVVRARVTILIPEASDF